MRAKEKLPLDGSRRASKHPQSSGCELKCSGQPIPYLTLKLRACKATNVYRCLSTALPSEERSMRTGSSVSRAERTEALSDSSNVPLMGMFEIAGSPMRI